MVESVAMEVLRLFFLQVDPCLFGESQWRAHHISQLGGFGTPCGTPIVCPQFPH
jgi:hypothetical protein